MFRDRLQSFLKNYWAVLLLISSVFVIRIIAAVLFPLEPDEEIYAYISRDIANGSSIFDSSTGVYRAPVFLYMMALWFKVFGVSFVSARIFAATCQSTDKNMTPLINEPGCEQTAKMMTEMASLMTL